MNPVIDELKELLCELYKLWGGDCADLVWADNGVSASQTILSAYQQHGAPSFGTPAQRTAFLSMLDQIDALLDDPGSTLEASATATLQAVVNALHDDLSPDSPGSGGSA